MTHLRATVQFLAETGLIKCLQRKTWLLARLISCSLQGAVFQLNSAYEYLIFFLIVKGWEYKTKWSGKQRMLTKSSQTKNISHI